MIRLLAPVLALVLAVTGTAPVAAAYVACHVSGGTRNGSDSLSGWPGSDDPNGANGSYGPSSTWHDSNEYEWCDPSDDWFKETYIKWGSTAVSKLKAERSTRSILIEQLVVDNRSYNYTGGHSSNLPYNGIYVADAFEQASQGYEEVSYIVNDPGTIVAGTNYYAYLQWEQEAKSGPINNNPLLQYVVVQCEYTKKDLFAVAYDPIGRWQKKIADNS